MPQKLVQPSFVDWGSVDNYILLNPFLTEKDAVVLSELAVKVSQQANLQSHIWLATSGSSAESQRQVKLVALSQRALVNSAQSVNRWIEATENDRWLQVLPFFHVGGLGIELRARLSGANIFYSQIEKWNPDLFAQECIHQQITVTSLVPTQVFDIVQRKISAPKSLRIVFVGGGQLSSDLYYDARNLGWSLLPSYGMTESGSMIACADLLSLNSLVEYPKIKILPHAKIKTNQDQLLIVEATSLLTMYAKNLNDEGTQFNFFDPKVEGAFTTEDCGEIVHGALSIYGRQTDFIKIAGEATHLGRLRELLKKIIQHEYIVLLTIPDQRLGHQLVLAYQADQASDIDQVVQNFNQQVLPFEKIRQTFAVYEIPKSAIGKIQYEKLKQTILSKID